MSAANLSLEQIKVWLLSNEDTKKVPAHKLLAAAIKDSQLGALKVAEDTDVLNAVWDLIERDKLYPSGGMRLKHPLV